MVCVMLRPRWNRSNAYRLVCESFDLNRLFETLKLSIQRVGKKSNSMSLRSFEEGQEGITMSKSRKQL